MYELNYIEYNYICILEYIFCLDKPVFYII